VESPVRHGENLTRGAPPQLYMALSAESQSRAIIRLALAAFASAIALRICDPLLPKLSTDFHVTTGQAAHVIAYFSVAYGLLQAFYGPLGDRYGKFRIITFGTLASIVGSVGAVFADSLDWLVIARIASGATAAAIIPLSMAWIGDNIPYEQRQATLARFLTGQILGMVAGQLLGGFFADTLCWRWAFVVLACLYLSIGQMLVGELRRNPEIDAKADGPADAPPQTAARPPLWRQFQSVLNVPWARFVLVTVFLEGSLVFGPFAFIPAYLHLRYGLTLTGAGAIFGIYGLGGLSYTLVTGRLVARLGERGLAFGGGILLSCAFLAFLLGSSWHWAVPASFIAGLGFYMLHNTLQTNATQMAPATRGTAVSMFASSFFMGQAVGVAGASMIVDSVGAGWVFAVSAAAVPLIGAWFAWVLRFRKT
jgi:predicted MFS family arabinose efflux permease